MRIPVKRLEKVTVHKTEDSTILKDLFQLGQLLKLVLEGTRIEVVVVFFYVDDFHRVLMEKVKC